MRRRSFLKSGGGAAVSLAVPFRTLFSSLGATEYASADPMLTRYDHLSVDLVKKANGRRASAGSPKSLVFYAPPKPYPGMRVVCDVVTWVIEEKMNVLGIRVWGGEVFGERWSKFANFSTPACVDVGDMLHVTYTIFTDQ